MSDNEFLTQIARALQALQEQSKQRGIPPAEFFQALLTVAATSMVLSQGREETAQLLRYLENRFTAADQQRVLSEVLGEAVKP